MSKYEQFFRTNAKTKTNGTYPATKALVDENGEPLLWTIRPINTAKNIELTDSCKFDVKIDGEVIEKFNDSKYFKKLICASVVEPNLHDKELQDSYGVMSPEDLVLEMISDPSEYNEFANYLQEYNGFLTSIDEKVEEAKN